MSVTLRMARGGTKKKPVFHIVAASTERGCRDGKYLERLGLYNPKAADGQKVTVNLEAAQRWINSGAQVSETVGQLLKAATESK